MPDADTGCCLINGKNGSVRGNGSWVLGRMMRDYHYWMLEPVKLKTEEVLASARDFDLKRAKEKSPHLPVNVEERKQAGLVVSFWSTAPPNPPESQEKTFSSGLESLSRSCKLASPRYLADCMGTGECC